jgi:hypothetical protein
MLHRKQKKERMEQKSDYDLLSGQGTVGLGLDDFRLQLHQLRKRT